MSTSPARASIIARVLVLTGRTVSITFDLVHKYGAEMSKTRETSTSRKTSRNARCDGQTRAYQHLTISGVLRQAADVAGISIHRSHIWGYWHEPALCLLFNVRRSRPFETGSNWSLVAHSLELVHDGDRQIRLHHPSRRQRWRGRHFQHLFATVSICEELLNRRKSWTDVATR
jgi:hypothetical protein